MRIGVTGTRSGMTREQRINLQTFLKRKMKSHDEVTIPEFHHGDCVGVDVEAALIASEEGYRIVCHPPNKEDLRGWFDSDETRGTASYFQRNRQLVDEVDLLVVIPYQNEWAPEGGTWYTHDYAEKRRVETLTLWPSEEVHRLIGQGR